MLTHIQFGFTKREEIENDADKICETITTENFPNMIKYNTSGIPYAQRTLYRMHRTAISTTSTTTKRDI